MPAISEGCSKQPKNGDEMVSIESRELRVPDNEDFDHTQSV